MLFPASRGHSDSLACGSYLYGKTQQWLAWSSVGYVHHLKLLFCLPAVIILYLPRYFRVIFHFRGLNLITPAKSLLPCKVTYLHVRFWWLGLGHLWAAGGLGGASLCYHSALLCILLFFLMVILQAPVGREPCLSAVLVPCLSLCAGALWLWGMQIRFRRPGSDTH